MGTNLLRPTGTYRAQVKPGCGVSEGSGSGVPTSQVRGSGASSAALIGIIVVLIGSSVGCCRAPGLVELGHYCSLTALSLSPTLSLVFSHSPSPSLTFLAPPPLLISPLVPSSLCLLQFSLEAEPGGA